uniref:RRM domain-containing protein n=1 Tax=Romanomermis culicivorax TaxID=13658 RepID=A0A915KFE7_ROMCU
DPPPSKCLGVFGLSTSTNERTLDKLFSKFGHVDKIQIIYNKLARDSCQGILIDGYRIRVDYSVTERAHPSTPGVYMGKRRDYGSPPVRKYRRSRSYSPRIKFNQFYSILMVFVSGTPVMKSVNKFCIVEIDALVKFFKIFERFQNLLPGHEPVHPILKRSLFYSHK